MKNTYFTIPIIFIIIILYYINKNKLNKKIKGGENKNWFKSEDNFTNMTEATNYCHSEKTNLLNSRKEAKGEYLEEDAWYRNDFGFSISQGDQTGIKKLPQEGPAVCEKRIRRDLEPTQLEDIKNFNQDFKEITHISELVSTDFNYNEFELQFNIKRQGKMIVDLDGGILTIGQNKSNFHNLFIHIKNIELIIGLIGYNTHLSINLNKIKSATTIYFRFIYKNPYLNIFVNAYDKNDVSTIGYLDYLGNITNEMNRNFRLYMHPILNGWCSLGTTNFVEMKNIDGEKKPSLISADGILNQEQTTISNLKIKHKKRNIVELYNETINDITNYSINYNLNNIIGFDLKSNESQINFNGKLVRIELENKNYLQLEKQKLEEDKSNIILSLQGTSMGDALASETLIEIDYDKKIYSYYFEIIPYMNLHLFCLYLNNDFNRYVIDLSNLKNKNNTYSNFKNIIINENNNPLIQKVKIFTEEFNYNRGQTMGRLYPIIDYNGDNALVTFKKNVKIEYIKILSSNNVIYTFYVKNIFQNKWKNILQLDLNEKNKLNFRDSNIIINDNTISNEYRFNLSTNHYYIIPINIINENDAIEKSNKNDEKMLNYTYTNPEESGEVKLAKDDFEATEWTFNLMTGINFEIKTKEIINPDGSTILPYYFYSEKSKTRKLMLEPKPNTSLFYIYYYPNGEEKTGAKKEYIYYLQDRQGKQKLTNKQDKKNCEFTIKQVVPKSDAVLPSEIERQEKLLKEKIAKLNKNLKEVEKNINENERKKIKFNSELGKINSKIIRQRNKIKNKNKQIDEKIGDIIDIDNEISQIAQPSRSEEQNRIKKKEIDEKLKFLNQEWFKNQNYFYSSDVGMIMKNKSQAASYCRDKGSSLMDYTKMSNNVVADAYYDNGYGYLRSSTAKTLSTANSPSAGYAHAMCWRKPIVRKLKEELKKIKNDNELIADKKKNIEKKNTAEAEKKK